MKKGDFLLNKVSICETVFSKHFTFCLMIIALKNFTIKTDKQITKGVT